MQALREDPLTTFGCTSSSHFWDYPPSDGALCRCGQSRFTPLIRKRTTEERLDWLTMEVATLRVQMNKLLGGYVETVEMQDDRRCAEHYETHSDCPSCPDQAFA